MIRKRTWIVFPICLLALVLLGGTSYAQNIEGSITFDMGLPQAEFKDNVNKAGLGVAVEAGFRLGKRSPFLLGVSLGALTYGTDRRYESFYDFPDLTVEVVNSYNILQGHLFLRFQPFNRGAIRPYLDILGGVNYLYAKTAIEDWDDETDISSVNFEDTALSYGAGIGLLIHMGRTRPDRPGERGMEFLLDLKARYLIGGNAQYLQEGSIVVDGQDVTYFYDESRTNLLSFQVGLAMVF